MGKESQIGKPVLYSNSVSQINTEYSITPFALHLSHSANMGLLAECISISSRALLSSRHCVNTPFCDPIVKQGEIHADDRLADLYMEGFSNTEKKQCREQKQNWSDYLRCQACEPTYPSLPTSYSA